ncbi:hypothetical protein Hoch_6195 [Haliangium ochraceum DSM 14365]|uniref:Lipoprotein n=2 Tax=Haliangium ochraceum TaxID=80816 RepID=D0LMI3_HALO1|nr:hypothetical protein Hoch_6195 [Haliangium ochraceum DSM 14365]
MRWGLCAILMLALSGCYVAPQRVTTKSVLATHVTTKAVAPQGAISVQAQSYGARVTVFATRPWSCEDRYEEVVEVHSELQPEFNMDGAGLGGLNDVEALLLVGLLSVPVVAVSSLVTGVVVSVDRRELRHERRDLGTHTRPCSMPVASLPVRVRLASGQAFELVTDEGGAAAFAIPNTEPRNGRIEVSAGDAHHAFDYALTE